MQAHDHYRRQGCAARPAFTLVELLIVIAIMGLLVSITAAAAVRVFSRQKASNTETLITMLSRALNQHWMAVIDQAKNEPIPAGVLALAGTDGDSARRARVIWIKLRLNQEFPTTFAEVVSPGGSLPPLPAYVRTLSDWGLPTT